MKYSVFNKVANDATQENMFFGEPVNVARYDQQRHRIFEQLCEKQLSFFWRPEEVDVSRDRVDYENLSDHEKHIFLSNLKYQTLLDSVQGRSPNVVLLPLVSIPELESWIELWASFEVIHSRSYTHIIRNVLPNPQEVFDDIVVNDAIIARATEVTKYYDQLLEASMRYQLDGEGTYTIQGREIEITLKELKKMLYLCIVAINVLEGVRFYVSFA